MGKHNQTTEPMDEVRLTRLLAGHVRARDKDYYKPPLKRDRCTKTLTGGSEEIISKRAPLTARERVKSERLRRENQVGEDFSKSVDENVHFHEEFDKWVDSQWPDRQVSTKIKVGFRKEHRKIVQELCLDDVEDIAKALS